MNVLGILPARAGSKGIPGKNLRPLCGRPLLAWAADAIIQASGVSRAICSTDDTKIAEVAEACGLEVPFMRPPELATDTALVADVIRHALDALDDEENPFTHVALVQATSPTVTARDVDEAIQLVAEGDADTVISGFQTLSHHPAIMYTLDQENRVSWLLGQLSYHRRQEFPRVFVRTGLIYLASVAIIRERGTLYGDRIRSLLVDEERAVCIDEERDFRRAERIMESLIGGS